MKLGKSITTLAGFAIMFSLSACGVTNTGTKTVEKTEERAYTSSDMMGAVKKCKPLNDPGKDVVDAFGDGDGNGFEIISFDEGVGIDSDSWKCVVEYLDIPMELAERVSGESTDGEETAKLSNLYMLWDHSTRTASWYFSLNEFED